MTHLSIAIQTHPARADLSSALAAEIPGVERVVDPDPESIPSPWRTYRHALERTPPDATHRLIIQDDVELCRDFHATVIRAVAARPERMLVFFVGGHPVEHARAVYRACDQDLPWAELDGRRWCPVIATCWPVAMIDPFLRYVDVQNWPEAFRSDDEIVGRWLRVTKQRPLASVPSLVEHNDVVPSLIGRRARAGKDRSRVAACFMCPDCDPAGIDWTLGPG
jgi:hypothetical protein